MPRLFGALIVAAQLQLSAPQVQQLKDLLAQMAALLSPVPPIATAGTVVPAGSDLQAAITAAKPGDALVLPVGSTFTGNFVLPVKAGPVTITSSAPPAAGIRVGPSSGFATLVSPNAGPVLATQGPANGWSIVGLELAGDGGGDLVTLGDGSSVQNTLGLVPQNLLVDRCYLHGSPARGGKRGIALNSGATTISHSYFADFKLAGQDSQAIAGWNGPGPYTITDNYLEAAGNNVIFGGADPAIPNLVPSDIVLTNNLVTKQLAWRTQAWQVKNLFELKNAQRVTATGNTFERCWSDAQTGTAIVFTVRNQDGAAPWSTVRDVLFDHNVVTHAAAVLQILGSDDTPGKPSQRMTHVVISHLVVSDIDPSVWNNPHTGAWGSGALMTIVGGLTGGVSGLDIGHVTVIGTHVGRFLALAGSVSDGVNVHDAIFSEGDYGITGDNTGLGRAAFAVFAPTAIFTHNAIIQGGSGRVINYGPQVNYLLPATTSIIGLANPTTDGAPIGG